MKYPPTQQIVDAQGEETFQQSETHSTQVGDVMTQEQVGLTLRQGHTVPVSQPKRQKTFPKHPDPHGQHAPAPLQNLDRLRPNFNQDEKKIPAEPASSKGMQEAKDAVPTKGKYATSEDKLREGLKVMFGSNNRAETTVIEGTPSEAELVRQATEDFI